ncbi:uncharacterized protein LOC135846449 [Planococcus citri]|uniref:uncharacterized protein LOC135846449 n=1 Tax=Planococcus citri TaxID=170843 RepID=UPI0031F9AA09
MEISNELLSKMLSADSSSKVTILNWRIKSNIIALGNNNTSELSRLKVEYQRRGRIFKKSFILKVPSAHPMYTIALKYKLYDKEYRIYTQVLEEMYKIDGERVGAKLYYANDQHSLIMKDLSLSGYKMADRVKQLDYEQCYLVLKSLAKFHALSVKLDQNSKLDRAIKVIPCLTETELADETIVYLNNNCEQLANCIDPKFGLREKILQIKDQMYEKLCQEMNPNRYRFNVLTHGDCWLGNTLFKFDKYGNVKKMKLIDFQCSSWQSPAYDILHFTLSSMRFDVFEKHFPYLMGIYIETLNRTLRFFHCGSYSLEELYRDMESSPVTICMILCMQLPETLTSHENPIDYRDFIHDGVVDFDSYNKLFENPIYLKVLNQWISYYVQKGLFD